MVTYKSLLDMMNEVRHAPYRSDPERTEATIAAVSYCLASLLEKEERHNGVSHTMAQIASHWDCLTPEQQAAAIKYYRLTEIV